MVNALKCHGKNASVNITRKLFSDPVQGTSEDGVVRALTYWGYAGVAFTTHKAKEAWETLHTSVASGAPVVLCVDKDQHWVAAIGAIGDRVLVFDSARNEKNLREAGVAIYTRTNFSRRWKNRDGVFYGIKVLPLHQNS